MKEKYYSYSIDGLDSYVDRIDVAIREYSKANIDLAKAVCPKALLTKNNTELLEKKQSIIDDLLEFEEAYPNPIDSVGRADFDRALKYIELAVHNAMKLQSRIVASFEVTPSIKKLDGTSTLVIKKEKFSSNKQYSDENIDSYKVPRK